MIAMRVKKLVNWWEARGLTIIKHPNLWEARGLTIIKHPDLWEASGLTIIMHPDLWEARRLTIIKHPGERSLKSYSKLLVVNSGNYSLDRLTADVYEGNITCTWILLEGNMMYLLTSITSITMLSSFSTTFLTMKKRNRVVFQSMRSGAVHHNGAQCCMRDFYFFSHCSPPPFKKFNKNICCEGYSKPCSRKIWLLSLSNITSK